MAEAALGISKDLLKDAKAVCEGTAKLAREFKPSPGDSAEDILAARVYYDALLGAVLLYLKDVQIPKLLREMGHTQPMSDARRESMAMGLRAKLLVDPSFTF